MSSVKFQWPAACAGWGRQEALQIEAAAQQYGDARAAEAEAQKDAAYEERNRVVALLAALLPSVRTRTAIEGWSEDWHGCVYITLPDGSQASWHFHDSQAHLFAHVPEGQATWDGHTTPEKYTRIERCTAARPNIAAAPQQPAVQPEPMARFCPGCGSVGPVPEKYRDCCPDGDKARMIPEALARHCHDLFHLALSAPGDALHPQRQSAIDPVTVLRLADEIGSNEFARGVAQGINDQLLYVKCQADVAMKRAALCRALGVADLHPQPQLDRAAAEKPKPASVTPLNPAAAWPFPKTYR